MHPIGIKAHGAQIAPHHPFEAPIYDPLEAITTEFWCCTAFSAPSAPGRALCSL